MAEANKCSVCLRQMSEPKKCGRCAGRGTISVRSGTPYETDDAEELAAYWHSERCPQCGGYGIEGVAHKIESGKEAIHLLVEVMVAHMDGYVPSQDDIETVKRLADELEA